MKSNISGKKAGLDSLIDLKITSCGMLPVKFLAPFDRQAGSTGQTAKWGLSFHHQIGIRMIGAFSIDRIKRSEKTRQFPNEDR
jgi:hypothetical protein